MPPPSGYPSKPSINTTNTTAPPSGAAQAAAQAAVMAAANSATPRPPHSAMYLRQHLQQKMYPTNAGQYPPHGQPTMPPMNPPQMGPHPGALHHGMQPTDQINTPINDPQNHSNYSMGSAPHGAPPPTSDIPNVGATTSVTQSITSPLSAATSLANSIAEGRNGPQPPPILDEASQASTSSSQAEDSSDTPKPNSKPPGLSHPPTPNTLGSPGAASIQSSIHDEFDSVSSPSWPRTPASPVRFD